MPAARPSSPSMKLSATFMPMIQKNVNATAIGNARSMIPLPSGSSMLSMWIPARITTNATSRLPRNCQRARSSNASSMKPTVMPSAAAIAVSVNRDERTSSGMRNGPPAYRSTSQNARIVSPNASAIARPPGRAIGRGCRRRPPGMSIIPMRSASLPTSGVISAASTNASTAEPEYSNTVMGRTGRSLMASVGTITRSVHGLFHTLVHTVGP